MRFFYPVSNRVDDHNSLLLVKEMYMINLFNAYKETKLEVPHGPGILFDTLNSSQELSHFPVLKNFLWFDTDTDNYPTKN